MNDPWTQSQIDDFNLKTAQDSLQLASEQNQKLSNESRELFDVFYDKLLLYSAGAFSFSVALIGLVVGDRIGALGKVGYLYPNIYWLYASLTLYLLTCVLVLLARRFDAIYVANFGMHLYCGKKKVEQETVLAKLMRYPGQVLISHGRTRQGEIQMCKDNINKLSKAETENMRRRDRAYFWKTTSHRVCEITVLLATILLLFFTVQLTQAMIWG